MNSSVCYEIHGNKILAITYTGQHTHGACFDWVHTVLRNDPEIPRRFALLIDLRPVMAGFEFEDLLDLARFWASQHRRLTSLAVVVDIPEDPECNGIGSILDANPQMMRPGAGFRIFSSRELAVKWLDPVCECSSMLM